MPRSGEQTRDRILDAAEALFAAKGLGAVPNSEITEAAGQRNNSAIAYHFGDRAGLVEAVLRRHAEPLEERRSDMVDRLPVQPTLADLVHVLVAPLAAMLQTTSGRAYLRIQAQLLSLDDGAEGLSLYVTDPRSRPGLDRIGLLMLKAEPPVSTATAGPRSQMLTSLLFHSLADRAGQTQRSESDEEFATALEAAIHSLLIIDLD